MATIEKCPESKHYEAYDWCNLSDNKCIRNTGNADFDVDCEYYNEFLREVRIGNKNNQSSQERGI